MFADFDRILGIEKFTLLHLNDSVVCLVSRKDEHAFIGTGQIWWKSFDSLVLLLDTCKKYGIPYTFFGYAKTFSNSRIIFKILTKYYL